MAGIIIRFPVAVSYLGVYCTVSIFVFFKLIAHNSKLSIVQDISLVMLLCSIAGLPPFVGFFPKIYVLFKRVFIVAVPLIVGSVVIVYVYINVALRRIRKLAGTKIGFVVGFLIRAPAVLM